MRTITRTANAIPLYIDHGKGTGSRKYITEFEAMQACEKGRAVIVDESDRRDSGKADDDRE